MTKAERKAYLCRIRNGINEFPITYDGILQIMREMGYKVLKYSEAKDLISEEKWEDCAANSTAFSGNVKGIFTIFIADSLNYEDRIEKIAHELGHIEQGHTTEDNKSNEQRQEEEDEANEFVPFFLAPPCYLDQLGLKTLEDVEEALPYSTKYCKLIFANLAAYQLRHEPMSYEEKTICSMMQEPEKTNSPQKEKTPDISSRDYTYPTVPMKVVQQYIPQPTSIPVKTKRLLAGMGILTGVVMVAMLCTIFMLVGQNIGRNQIIPYSTSPSEPHTPSQPSQSVEGEESSFYQSHVETSSEPVSQPESESTTAVESSHQTQPESRIVSSVEDEGMLVYVTTTGSKYHKWGCQYINGKTNLIDMYISEAQDKGYQPCKVCFGK